MDMKIGGVGKNIADQISQKLLDKTDPGAAGAPTAAPASGDVEKFQAALNRDLNPTPHVTPVGPAAETAKPVGTAPAVKEEALGDRILRGFENLSDKIQAERTGAIDALAKEDAGPADLLRANFAMIEANLEVSAVSKTTEKINQDIKTLQQG